MVRSFSLAALVIAMAIVACGCGGTQVGKPIIRYQRNAIAVPLVQTVSSAGLYTLFPGDGITPLEAVYLNPGDQYGFKSSEGKVCGFYTKAGASKLIALDGVLTSEYVWKYQGDKQP